MNPEFATQIEEISSVILNESASHGELRNASHQLMQLLDSIHQIDAHREKLTADLMLDNGKAVSALTALHCLIDYVRTMRFMRGIYKAIVAQKRLKPGKKIHVCYAGTGPYAPLILPSIANFSPEEVSFTLMEIQPSTFELLNKTIHVLGIGPWIRQSLMVDGTQFQFAETDRPDIIVSETMQLALRKEMQVPLTLNLCPQLADQGVFIPENIKVSIGRLEQQKRNPAGEISLLEFNTKNTCPSGEFEKHVINLNQFYSSLPATDELYFFTEIVVFENEDINYQQSGLTMALSAYNPRKWETQPSALEIQYVISENPGFKVNAFSA